jgi:hypothetical protein
LRTTMTTSAYDLPATFSLTLPTGHTYNHLGR